MDGTYLYALFCAAILHNNWNWLVSLRASPSGDGERRWALRLFFWASTAVTLQGVLANPVLNAGLIGEHWLYGVLYAITRPLLCISLLLAVGEQVYNCIKWEHIPAVTWRAAAFYGSLVLILVAVLPPMTTRAERVRQLSDKHLALAAGDEAGIAKVEAWRERQLAKANSNRPTYLAYNHRILLLLYIAGLVAAAIPAVLLFGRRSEWVRDNQAQSRLIIKVLALIVAIRIQHIVLFSAQASLIIVFAELVVRMYAWRKHFHMGFVSGEPPNQDPQEGSALSPRISQYIRYSRFGLKGLWDDLWGGAVRTPH